MPQVGAWIAASVMGLTGVAAAVVGAVINLAISYAIAKITAPKGPRPQELQSELRSSNAKRMRHLGRVRVSGAVLFWDWAHVGKERRLFKLIAVAEGGMTAVDQWYLDGKPVTVDGNGYVTSHPWNKANVRLQWRAGIQDNQWDGGDYADLRAAFPAQWTVDHRCRGVGTILASFDAVGGKELAEVYSGGEPEVSALIKGARAYWAVDGSQAWAPNTAKQLSDVIANPTYGPLTAADLNLTSFAGAGGACFEAVPTTGGTRPRYNSGISYALADPLKDTAQKLLDAMGGRAWVTPEGKMAIEAGVWVPPTITIEERHIVEMEYGAGTDRINRVTTLVPTYVAPEVYWQETNADPVEDLAGIAKWGEGEPKGIDLLAVQHHGQAAHLTRQKLALMNPDRKMTIKLRTFGLRLIGEGKVAVNIPRLNLVNAPFWINSLAFDGTNVTVDLIEANPAAIADIAPADEGSPPPTPDAIDQGTADNDLTLDSLTVTTNDGPPYIRASGDVNAAPGNPIVAQYRRNPAGVWTDMLREDAATGRYTFRTPPLADLAEYDVRVFFGYREGGTGALVVESTPIQINGVDVVVNDTPPSDPVVFAQSGAAGGTLTVTFQPDLGANYRRTGLYRAAAGAAFGTATLIKWSYDTSSDVTMTAPIPASGARFWLQSENPSERKSGVVLVGNYPA